jgi:peptide/nickel transport system permease protein/oligopeptide transport system permease protein
MADALAQIAAPNGWSRLKRNRPAMIALWFLMALSLVAVVAPVCLSDGLKHTSTISFARPLAPSEDGSLTHLCGTDVNGQDLFYRLLTGARVSLGIGLVGACVALCIGVLYGMTAGFSGGRVDAFMMRVCDTIESIPSLLLIMVFISAFDGHFKGWLDDARLWFQSNHWPTFESWMAGLLPYSRVLVMVITLGLVEWITMARIVRGQVLVLRELAFVTASRAMGQRWWRIFWKHLLPNLSTVILTYLTLTIPSVIRSESFLSFLGLGIEDPAASWGSLLKDGAQVINPIDSKWWLLVFPAALMSMSLLALNFVGDGLRDAFDPKSSD